MVRLEIPPTYLSLLGDRAAHKAANGYNVMDTHSCLTSSVQHQLTLRGHVNKLVFGLCLCKSRNKYFVIPAFIKATL